MTQSTGMTQPIWTLTRHGRVAVATFHHPPRNFMTFANMTELEGIVRTVAADEEVTVMVIASDVPGYFVAHGDLPDLLKLGSGAAFDGDAAAWPRTLELFADMPQVVVAAINGQAWGGGLEMSLAATMRVAGPQAHFALCELGLGLIPGGGGTQRLPRLIGPGRAAELILTARAIDAQEAHHIGLVQHVFDGDDFLEQVLAWCEPIANRSPAALRAAKQSLRNAAELPLSDGLAAEGALVGPLLASERAVAEQEAAIARYATTPAEVVVHF